MKSSRIFWNADFDHAFFHFFYLVKEKNYVYIVDEQDTLF